MKTCLKCGKTYPDDQTFCPEDNTSLVARSADQEDALIGRVLAGRYQITARIARGGMGSVYRALHTKMNRTCALKVLSQAVPDADSVARFNREAQMASKIDNPHAVTIYDFGEAEDGLLYLAMEYIEGEPLSLTIARERSLPMVRVANITSQIAQALSAAHLLGIIHRDLKPDNIMITRKGGNADYVKVLDFGIAKVVAEGNSNETLTQAGIVLGTPPYMSPEQLTGEHLDPRSDVYSLALIVYQMICGKLPFTGQTSQTIMMKRLTHEPIKLRENAPFVSEAVESVVMSALKRERESRQDSVGQFASEFAQALGDEWPANDKSETVPIGSSQASGAEYRGPTQGRGTAASVSSQETEGGQSETEIATTPMPGMGATSAQNSDTSQNPPPSAYVTKRSPLQEAIADPPPIQQPAPSNEQRGVTLPYWDQSVPLVSQSNRGPVGQEYQPQEGRPIQAATPEPPAVSASLPGHPPPYGGEEPPHQSSMQPLPGPTRASSISVPPGVGARPIPPTAVFPGSQPMGVTPRSSRAPIVVVGVLAVVVLGGLAAAGYFVYLRSSTSGSGPSSRPGGVPTPLSATPSTPNSGGAATPEGTPGVGSSTALDHYNAGKEHQNQGALLQRGDSKTEAVEEYKKSIVEYREAVRIQPEYPEAHENLAVALYDTGDPQTALDEYRIAIDQYTKRDGRPTSQVMTNYGLALFDLGRYSEAADAFGQALKLDPTDHDLYVHRGFALQNAGKTEEAKSDYDRYLSLEPAGQYAADVRAVLSGKANPPSKSGN